MNESSKQIQWPCRYVRLILGSEAVLLSEHCPRHWLHKAIRHKAMLTEVTCTDHTLLLPSFIHKTVFPSIRPFTHSHTQSFIHSYNSLTQGDCLAYSNIDKSQLPLRCTCDKLVSVSLSSPQCYLIERKLSSTNAIWAWHFVVILLHLKTTCFGFKTLCGTKEGEFGFPWVVDSLLNISVTCSSNVFTHRSS